MLSGFTGGKIVCMKAVIYQPAKNVMQSGRGKASVWVIEFDRNVIRKPESLMGWTSSDSTSGQVKLSFSSLEQAKSFAEDNGLSYFIKAASTRKVRPRNYGDNFIYQPFEEKA